MGRVGLLAMGVCVAAMCSCERAARRGSEQRLSDSTTAVVVARIGELEGPEEYLFGEIGSVVTDSAGRIYVADRVGSFIRVYDPSGQYLAQIGRSGQGPGEYDSPFDMTVDPFGRLYVRDYNRITVLDASFGSEIPDSVVRTMRIPGYANTSSTRSRSDGERYYYPASLLRRVGPEEYFYLVFDSAGFTGDTVRVPPMETLQGTRAAFYRIGQSSGRMVDGLNRAPFEPAASWDITREGSVVSTTGLSRTVSVTNARQDTVRVFDVFGVDRAVPSDERRDSTAALQQRIDSLPVPIDEVLGISKWVRVGELPDSLPATISIYATDGGDIWVGRWPPKEHPEWRVFAVFARDGRQKTVVVPVPLVSDPPPYVTDRTMVGVVRDALTDVESVVVLTFKP